MYFHGSKIVLQQLVHFKFFFFWFYEVAMVWEPHFFFEFRNAWTRIQVESASQHPRSALIASCQQLPYWPCCRTRAGVFRSHSLDLLHLKSGRSRRHTQCRRPHHQHSQEQSPRWNKALHAARGTCFIVAVDFEKSSFIKQKLPLCVAFTLISDLLSIVSKILKTNLQIMQSIIKFY